MQAILLCTCPSSCTFCHPALPTLSQTSFVYAYVLKLSDKEREAKLHVEAEASCMAVSPLWSWCFCIAFRWWGYLLTLSFEQENKHALTDYFHYKWSRIWQVGIVVLQKFQWSIALILNIIICITVSRMGFDYWILITLLI